MRRRAWIIGGVAVLLATSVLPGCSVGGGGGVQPGPSPNPRPEPEPEPQPEPGGHTGAATLELMVEAEGVVLEEHPHALLVELSGVPSAGTAMTADDVDVYQFRFVEDINSAGPGTVVLDYADGEFAEPRYLPQTLFGTVFDPLPRKLTLADAVGLLREAGYDEPFSSFALRRPLTYPLPKEALFLFTLPDQSVSVGAETGQVNGAGTSPTGSTEATGSDLTEATEQ